MATIKQNDLNRYTEALGQMPSKENVEWLVELEEELGKELSVDEIRGLLQSSIKATEEQVPVSQPAKLMDVKELEVPKEVKESLITETIEVEDEDGLEKEVVLPVKKNIPPEPPAEADKAAKSKTNKTPKSEKSLDKQGNKKVGENVGKEKSEGKNSNIEPGPKTNPGNKETTANPGVTEAGAGESNKTPISVGVIPSNLDENQINAYTNVFIQHLMRMTAYQAMIKKDPKNSDLYSREADISLDFMGKAAVSIFDGDISVTRITKPIIKK